MPGETCPKGQVEVLIRREGVSVILEPLDVWPEDFRACLGGWDEEIICPPQGRLTDLKGPFGDD